MSVRNIGPNTSISKEKHRLHPSNQPTSQDEDIHIVSHKKIHKERHHTHTEGSLPVEVTSFEPPIEAVKVGEGPKQLRHIFGKSPGDDLPVPLDAFEKEALKDLHEHLKNNNFRISKTVFADDHYIVRFLQGNDWATDRTMQDMEVHLKWRKENLPITRRSVEDYLDSGFSYIYGRDRCMRPVLVLSGQLLSAVDDQEKALLTVIYWLEYGIKRLMVTNRVEQFTVVIDLTDVAFYNIPLRLLQKVASTLQSNYRGRLSRLYFLNTPTLFWGVWSAISPILPPSTRGKVVVLSSDYQEALHAAIHPNQLEEKFGGLQPDNSRYDIPVFPPAPYT